MLVSVTALGCDRDSEWEAQFPLASLVDAIGRAIRAVRGFTEIQTFAGSTSANSEESEIKP
jgi:hypothetical protein